MNHGDLDVVHSSLNPAGVSFPKIAVLDWGCEGTLVESDKQYFKSLSIRHQSYDRKRCIHESDTMISPLGFSCASIICSRRRHAKFFNVCEKEFEGICPEAEVIIYSIGCKTCDSEEHLMDALVKALDRAIEDKVKVVLACMELSLSVNNSKHIELGMKLLEVQNNGILPLVPIGDKGPTKGSTQHGAPWCMIVGASTNKQVLKTNIQIAIEDEDENLKMIKTLKGISLNVIDTQFLPLWVAEDATGNEGMLEVDMSAMKCSLFPAKPCYGSAVIKPSVTGNPLAYINEVDELKELHSKHRGRLFIRIKESKYKEDKRRDFVTNFSSRGPSRFYEENLVPDVVAPGYAILAPHPTGIPLNCEGNPMFADITIDSGTSYACAQVAAYALKVFSRHPDWMPSAIKSALITTASSFNASSYPGNEFSCGAGSIDIDRGLNPGLVYEESSDHFREYVKQDRTIFDLNLATFAASFGYSHLKCERIFKRELKNVSERYEEYTSDIKFFERSFDPYVQIKVEPAVLKFRPGEKQKFELHVEILPRPGGEVSAVIEWTPTNGHQPVCSPIHLYHHSLYDKDTPRYW